MRERGSRQEVAKAAGSCRSAGFRVSRFDDSGWNSATSIFRFGKEKNRAHEGRGPLLQGTLGEGLCDNLLLNVVSCPFSLPIFWRPAFCLLFSWPVFLLLSFWQASFSGLSLPELSLPASWPLSF